MVTRDRFLSCFVTGLVLSASLACATTDDSQPSAATPPEGGAASASGSSPAEEIHVEQLDFARSDPAGGQPIPVKSFHPEDNPFHFVLSLSDSSANTAVRVVVFAVRDESAKDQQVGTADATTSPNEGTVDLVVRTRRALWRKGRYRVDAQVNGRIDRTERFVVE